MKRVVFAVTCLSVSLGCGHRSPAANDAGITVEASGASSSSMMAATLDAATVQTRPGMAWIPAGSLRAGTPKDKIPRVADEEMSGTPVELGGFYIDLLPYPNEPNAIPTSNVSRDEAEQLCVTKGKRLCTELEWERACKGPDNTTYEYGDAYRAPACGTGVALEQASHRPTGEHAQCKSGFGVAEMHGGPWEWTSSAWGRGSKDAAQGVLRGGNSVAGELVGRCANAIARADSKKSPTMGLRCCAGTKNTSEVKLDVAGSPSFIPTTARVANLWSNAVAKGGSGATDAKTLHAWTWIPVGNEELVVTTGCVEAPRSCVLVVGRGDATLATVNTGHDPPEITHANDLRHLRIRALDGKGIFSREVTYAYGRVEVGPPKRP